MDTTYKGYAELNPQQRMKCAQFLTYHNEQRSVELTELLEKSGENSYKRVLAKIHILTIERDDVKIYHNELYDAIALDQPFNVASIIRTVSQVRLKLGLTPYTHSLTANCLNDFNKLFIVKVSYIQQPTASSTLENPKYRKVKDVYTPVFKLMP